MQVHPEHWMPYPHPHPPYGGIATGLIIGGLAGFTTAMLVDMALDDARSTYKEKTGNDMIKCSDLPASIENKIKDDDCHSIKDDSMVCFFKSGNKKEESACYIPVS
jgi:hypothetical protein